MAFADLDFFPFVVGFLGSLHCLGMCGVLVFAASVPCRAGGTDHGHGRRRKQSLSLLLPHVMFHLGRLTTYAAAGAIAAGFFNALQLIAVFDNSHSCLTIGCGILLIVFALVMLKLIPIPAMTDRLISAPLSAIVSWAPSLLRSSAPGSKYFLGLLTGLLPCCLSWSMVVTVASTHDPLIGFVTMLCFGLGTVPALIAAALFGIAVSATVRQAGEKLAALTVGAMGIFLVLRGVGILG
jgi:uncharacterized protein